MSNLIPVLVSADGFFPEKIEANQGDTIDLQPSGPTPPASVSVTVSDSGPSRGAGALFGIPYPVPSRQTVLADHGVYLLRAGRHTATIVAKPASRELMEPKPDPNPRS